MIGSQVVGLQVTHTPPVILAALRDDEGTAVADRAPTRTGDALPSGAMSRAHAIDSFERARTRTLRGLLDQADLLGDALHALRNGRTCVADEFVERAQQAIRDEIARLRGDRLDG